MPDAVKVVQPPVEQAKPLYKLIQPLYADDIFIEAETRGPMGLEATVIEYEGEPNESMEPMNEPARQNMRVFLDKLAAGNRAIGRQGDRTPPIGDIVQQAMTERPREMPVRRDDTPPIANTRFENGAGKPFAAPEEKAPQVNIVKTDNPTAIRPRRIMGTSQPEAPLLQTGQET